MIKNCDELTAVIEAFVSRTVLVTTPDNLWMSASMNSKFTRLHFRNLNLKWCVSCTRVNTHTHTASIMVQPGSCVLKLFEEGWLTVSHRQRLFSAAGYQTAQAATLETMSNPQRCSISHSSSQQRHWLCLQECFLRFLCSKHGGREEGWNGRTVQRSLVCSYLLCRVLQLIPHSLSFVHCML